jgi:hypothetical protein
MSSSAGAAAAIAALAELVAKSAAIAGVGGSGDRSPNIRSKGEVFGDVVMILNQQVCLCLYVCMHGYGSLSICPLFITDMVCSLLSQSLPFSVKGDGTIKLEYEKDISFYLRVCQPIIVSSFIVSLVTTYECNMYW